jgi:hypothetical protein
MIRGKKANQFPIASYKWLDCLQMLNSGVLANALRATDQDFEKRRPARIANNLNALNTRRQPKI